MNKHYYWECSVQLRAGSIVEPGNWGRLVSNKNHKHHSREMILEQVRALHFPNKPSRLKSVFVCETQADLEHYVNKYGKTTTGLKYEVELEDPNASIHRGTSDLGRLLSNSANDMVFSVAYWGDVHADEIEILSESALKIVSRIP